MCIAKLEKLVAEQSYWWSNLCADCVRTCQDCEDSAHRHHRVPYAPHRTRTREGGTWNRPCLVHRSYGRLSKKQTAKSPRHHRRIERLTRWVETRAIPNKKPPTVARFILEEIIALVTHCPRRDFDRPRPQILEGSTRHPGRIRHHAHHDFRSLVTPREMDSGNEPCEHSYMT
jgi:hypothetical protein